MPATSLRKNAPYTPPPSLTPPSGAGTRGADKYSRSVGNLLGPVVQDIRKEAKGSRYDEFKRRYKHDRVGFVRDCFEWEEGKGPTFYQSDLLRELDEGCTRLSWRGPRGCGKTSTCAWIVIHHVLTHDGNPNRDWKVGMTASVGRQLEEFLWPEIHKWIRRLRWEVIGRKPFRENKELMTQSIAGQTGQVYSFVSNDPDKVEGCHADDVLIIFDESKAVPEASRIAVMGGVTGAGADTNQHAVVIAVSTPGPPAGWFYDIHRGAERFYTWSAHHITQAMCLQARVLSKPGLDELAAECGGTHTAQFKRQGLGEFAADEVMGLISLEHVELAQERWRLWCEAGKPNGAVTSVGIDVSDGGANATILAPVCGLMVDDLVRFPRIDKSINEGVSQMMSEVGKAFNFMEAHDMAKPVCVVDANAAGAGFASRLKEMAAGKNWTVESFKSQEKPPKGKTFKHPHGDLIPGDKRAAGYLLLAFLLDPDNGFEVGLPDDKNLKLQLTTIKRKPEDSSGRTFIESKVDIAKRLDGQSTDEADAVMQALTVGRLAVPKKKARFWSG